MYKNSIYIEMLVFRKNIIWRYQKYNHKHITELL